jgi:L-lactate dehydrogenase complex protein LldG
MDRDGFLARVGQAARRAPLPPSPEPFSALPGPGSDDLVGLFRERAMAVDAMVHGPVDPSGVPNVVAGIVSGHGCETFVAWDDLPVPGVTASLSTGGCQRVSHDISAEERLEQQQAYRRLDCGVTGADAGLAESGSVVLVHGPGRPRMASLIPEIHVALLPTSVVHRSLAHWAHRTPGAPASTANLVVITGPSRTGDIELQLNLGVHGPRIVHVVLMQR